MSEHKSHINLQFVKDAFITNRWGGQSLISLYISLLSGIVIALQYDAAQPYYSTTTIELAVPFGSFWRALHYYSSQAFFLLCIGHIIAVLWKQDESLTRKNWLRLCSSFPLIVLLLFTGYILRGDATGKAAGAIAENICLSIPLIGSTINDFFFDIQDSGIRKVYIHHIIGLVVMAGWALWPHLKKYPAIWQNHTLLVLVTITVSALFTTPVEPERFGLLFIAGPWFFLGLQELLRFLPVFIAGVIAPLIPIVLLYLLPTKPIERKPFLLGIIFWLIAYTMFTIISYVRI